jgi:hypothetical protein
MGIAEASTCGHHEEAQPRLCRTAPSGSYRAVAHAGVDPPTGREHYLRESAPTRMAAQIQGVRAATHGWGQVALIGQAAELVRLPMWIAGGCVVASCSELRWSESAPRNEEGKSEIDHVQHHELILIEACMGDHRPDHE